MLERNHGAAVSNLLDWNIAEHLTSKQRDYCAIFGSHLKKRAAHQRAEQPGGIDGEGAYSLWWLRAENMERNRGNAVFTPTGPAKCLQMLRLDVSSAMWKRFSLKLRSKSLFKKPYCECEAVLALPKHKMRYILPTGLNQFKSKK